MTNFGGTVTLRRPGGEAGGAKGDRVSSSQRSSHLGPLPVTDAIKIRHV